MLMVVVLPAPFGPRKPKISPGLHAERHALDGLELAERLARPSTSMITGYLHRMAGRPFASSR